MASKAKNAIISAFLELAKEYEFEKITVTNLVEKCSISRQTFYYHFNDIEEMLKWAFKNETNIICSYQTESKWKESAELYINFLNKYDRLLRSAVKSSKFIYIYNLLKSSFDTYITSYFENKTNMSVNSKADVEFLVNCLSNCFTGLVLEEIQKEKSDYTELLGKIVKGFKVFPKNK